MSTNTSKQRTASDATIAAPGAGAANPAGVGRSTPRWLIVLAAVLGALAVWAIGAAAGVENVTVASGTGEQQVTAVAVIVATLVIGLAGWGVRVLIGTISRTRAQLIWLVLAGFVLLVSLLGPLGAATPGAMLVLLAEHLMVGLILLLGLRR